MLSNLHKRFVLFLIGCIGVRAMLTVLAKRINPAYLPYMGYMAMIPVTGWVFIYFLRPRNTGPEVFGGKIWWNQLRPIHAGLYAIFAILAIRQSPYAYAPLALDTLLGLGAFLTYHLIL